MGGPITLESQPEGALVLIDGHEVGATPLWLPGLPVGPHGLSLVAEDHETWTGDLLVLPGLPLTRRVTLQPLPALLSLKTHLEGVRLWADGQEAGALPLETRLPPGRRSLRIELDGYAPWEGPITLRPNESRSLYVVPSGGQLMVSYADATTSAAVMVDNYRDARPQVGLNQADVVYEALAEGGITRFMALFLTGDADVVGPVRSTRHYFVHWANEYGAPLVHIGASPQAYAALRASQLPDLDGRGFWRSNRRPAPHNAFVSTAEARAALRGQPRPSFGGLRFRIDDERPDGEPAAAVRIVYAPPSGYTLEWTYDPDRGRYLRSMEGAPHLDGESQEQVQAANVLVLWMDSWPIPNDTAGRLDFQLTGRGRVLALTAGQAIEGEWRRPSLSQPTEYRDPQGRPILLEPGPTWIQVVPLRARIELSPAG